MENLINKYKGRKMPALFTVICALVIEIVIFSIASPYFLTVKNFLKIGLYAAIVGVISCSVTFINISGNIDLSVGSQIAAVGMVAAIFSRNMGFPWYGVVPVCLFTGMVMGAINGFFITVLKLNAFITTIATMQIFRGFAYLVTAGMSIGITDQKYIFLGRGYVSGIPISLIVLLVTNIIFHLISKYTVFGRNIYLIGGNPMAAFLSGVKVNKLRFQLYLLNGFMCAVSGILMSAQTGAGVPNTASTYNMTALSAVILGGAALTGGKGTILGTFLGSMVLSILSNGMTILSIGVYWQEIVIGMVLLLAVSLDAIKGGSLRRKI